MASPMRQLGSFLLDARSFLTAKKGEPVYKAGVGQLII